MSYLKNNILFIFLLFSVIPFVTSGCSHQKINAQDLLNQPIEEVDHFKFSKKYTKAGITVVYLTGSPYEIGFANGKLCKKEILIANKPFLDIYEKVSLDPQNKWPEISKKLEIHIPEEYLEEMRGIADGAEIEYEKILFLNTLTTISMGNKCFAFAFKENNSKIVTLRQIDEDKASFLYKNMILYIIKPQKGYGFAAILNPGWVDGESGINEKGITVSQNNIHIRQTEWDIMPITQLSRQMLQYSKTIDEAEQLLDKQKAFPARLLFVSSKESASIFEIANKEKARMDMVNGFLTLANHACLIPSQNVLSSSTRRLDFGNEFLDKNLKEMDKEKALELVRSSRISWRWNLVVHNRQSFIFSPSDLDFWIAIPPDSNYKPASHGTYIGFNLWHELYGSGDEANPKSFPAY
ncbi:MAG: C45 family autoproteolytic acyltransferase/hydrolase [Deltaproteobacteria bacterium]|jgi:predicted choloylglycine hydrolase